MANFDRLFGLFTENKKYSDIKRVKHLNEWSLSEGHDYSNKLQRNCELPEGAFADAFRRYLHLNNILYSASGAWENIHFECFFESQDDIDRANAFIDQYDKEGHAPVIDEQSNHIHLDGFGSLGDDSTWRVVDSMSDPTHGKVFLLKFNKPIDTAWDVIVDEGGDIIADHVKNGFDDLNSGVKKATWQEGCSGKKKASKKSTKKSVKEDVDDGSDTIRVLIVEPKKAPMVDNISQSLQSLQKIVGGYIECVYPFEDEVCIICNEEGKIDGLPLNRPLYGDDGQIYDIIAGTFIVAGLDDYNGEFASLDDNLIKKYEKLFHEPFKGYGRYESLKSKNILKKKTSRFVKENRNRITPNKIIDDASLDVEDMFSADNYRGFHIDKDFPVEGMYSVFVEGDDWLFDSIEEARKAIDEYLDAEFSAYTESKKRRYESRTPSNSSFKKEADRLVNGSGKYMKGRSSVYLVGDKYLYTDGAMCLISDTDLNLGIPSENQTLNSLVDNARKNCTREVSIPKLVDLTQYIKNDVERQKQNWTPGYLSKTRTFHKDRTFYDFGKNDFDEIDETLPMVDTKYLKSMLNAMGNDVKCYVGDKSTSPLYFISSKGEGIIMPVRRNYANSRSTKESYDPLKAQLTIVKENKTRVVESDNANDWPWVWYDGELDRYVSLDYLRETFEYFMREVPEEAEEYGIDTFDDYLEYLTDDMGGTLEPIGDTIEDDYRLRNKEWHPCQDAIKYGLINSFEELEKSEKR